jgi:bifunctional non-homologous end joining protein LigD
MSLTEYTRKRDFKKTAEPQAALGNKSTNRFVIQKHAASRLHYDFRLELNGVLKSWAVPKGVPFAKGEKRLAVQVEDHPVSYINFEGTIPKGQYGGGTVMVWDKGVYVAGAESPLKELKKGKLHFALSGKKLNGEWYLVQLRRSTQWLLIKGSHDLKRISKKMDDTSALSGKTMAQLSNGGTMWQSKPRGSASSKQNSFKDRIRGKASVRKALPVKFIPPMKAKLVKLPPSGDEREVEIKFDGYWARAFKNGGSVQLLSRNEKDFNEKFPEIVEAVHELKIRQAEIDGEIVALNEKGISKFQLLQAYELGEKRPPLFFYAFDLLRLNGKDLTKLPLVERKAQLEKVLGNKSGLIRYSASLGDDAKRLLKLAKKTGLEGLICKRKDSLYEAGERSGAWVKFKLPTPDS